MISDSVFSDEIYQQPAALAGVLLEADDAVRDTADRIRTFEPEVVLLAARGTSDNAARYAQYLFGAFNGLVCALAAPSLFTLYRRPPRLCRTLAIGISQSGQSPDVVTVIEETRRQGGLTLAITNDPSSPLASAATALISLGVGPELCVAATKTYSCTLLVLAMLSAAIERDCDRTEVLLGVPQAVTAALAHRQMVADTVHELSTYSHFLVIGRGYNYSTAFEIALKMKETSHVSAEAYSMADLMHGPVAMVDEQLPVILIAPSGAGSSDAQSLLSLLEKRGAKAVVFLDSDSRLSNGKLVVRVPSVPEWLSPLVMSVPGQLLALELAVARGQNPDRPLGLSKITETY
jgi:glucosamine--fructose-6-phosphate aminotransferase (isomerizing)